MLRSIEHDPEPFKTAAHRPPAFETAHILVIDDDPILREFAKLHLTTDHIQVDIACDGGEAWNMLRSGKFDLALVNLEMPVMDGYELMLHIRGHPTLRHLPVVVVTGLDDMSSIDRAYATGATAFAVKPLNWRLLAHQLSYVLRDSRENARIRRKAKQLRDTVRGQDHALAACEKGLADLQYALLENPTASASLLIQSPDGAESILGVMYANLEALRRATYER